MTKTVVTVEGMMCRMCEKHVNEAVERAFPVESVHSDHEKKSTEILSREPASLKVVTLLDKKEE